MRDVDSSGCVTAQLDDQTWRLLKSCRVLEMLGGGQCYTENSLTAWKTGGAGMKGPAVELIE